MLTHGHSFVRLLGWQLGCWSFWAIVAPWVVRVSGRQGFWRLAGLGVALTGPARRRRGGARGLAATVRPVRFLRFRTCAGEFVVVSAPCGSARVRIAHRRRPGACGARACPTARAPRVAARVAADPRAARRPAARDSAAFSVQHVELDRGADPRARPRRRAVDAARVERSHARHARRAERGISRRSVARCR